MPWQTGSAVSSPLRPSRRPPPGPELLRRLREAELDVLGRMPWASNGTYLVRLCDGGEGSGALSGTGADDEQLGARAPLLQGIYKPERGERPLWDFPAGLYKREAAAFELADALGWHVVPPTLVREGPLGRGSVQLFVEADFEQHYFTLQEESAHRRDFQAICVFDLLANNTDRKSGHCLLGRDGQIWAIDNGLCFAAEFKLRTVIWDFGGEPIPAELLDDVDRLVRDGLPDPLAALLDAEEREALLERATSVVTGRHFPHDRTGRRYPWPLV
ncbi:MAG: SCO1664 family protein [Acidimicrobiia bacterium]|nr:SCO1664 family protein [Acidimicrobiia bacterium]